MSQSLDTIDPADIAPKDVVVTTTLQGDDADADADAGVDDDADADEQNNSDYEEAANEAEDSEGDNDDVDDDENEDDDDENDAGDVDDDMIDAETGAASVARQKSRATGSNAISMTLHSTDTPVPAQFMGDNNMTDVDDDDDYDGDDLSTSGDITGDDDDDEDEDDDPETYLQKFDLEMNKNLLLDHHPTQFHKNDDEIAALSQLTRDANNSIVDPMHKTIPFLTKYEKTRVLGQRAKQINGGSKPYVAVPDHVIDGYIIAQMELAQKRIPFIIERPVHGGGSEYWKVRDLEIL